ncbi:MAG: NAD-dependent epimerase/dehydratase [Saccharofermentans sp.]|nr:NAD-dependent epimerase/dehydratase [Saccharofermentans sp.]
MTVLVLGGNGYVGQKLSNLLAKRNDEVICTVRNTKAREELTSDKIRCLPASSDAIETALRYTDVDVVVNCACNYGRSEGLYGDVIEANIEFPLKVLDLVASKGVKKYITIGTGLPDEINMYSYSKKMFSDFGKFYTDKKGINFINLKLEMLYGFDEPENRFLPSVIRKSLRGVDIDMTEGTQKRDIIAINDILKAILAVIDADIEGYKEIDIGTGEAPSIYEIVKYIAGLGGDRSQVNRGKVVIRRIEPDCVADVTEISKITDWNPVFWKDGLKDMFEKIKEGEL